MIIAEHRKVRVLQFSCKKACNLLQFLKVDKIPIKYFQSERFSFCVQMSHLHMLHIDITYAHAGPTEKTRHVRAASN